MKSTDFNRRLSSLFISPNSTATKQASNQKFELENEVNKVQEMLSVEYTVANRTLNREGEALNEESKILKSALNKIVNDNKKKEKKLSSIVDLIKCYSIVSPRNISGSTPILSSFHDEEEKIDDLREQLEVEDEKIQEEESNIEILTESKNNIIKNTLALKEKLEKLSKIHKDIEKKHNEVMETKQKAFYSMQSAQTDLSKLRKYIEKDQKRFQKAMEKWKTIKDHHEKEVQECINKISRENLKSRENKIHKEKILKKLQERIKTSEKNTRQTGISKEEISIIKKQLDLIKSYIPDCPDFLEPLSEENIIFIINSYSKFKFQEHSLSVKFQNLTEEQLEKQRKCDIIKEELDYLKSSSLNATDFNIGKSMTYNQLKISLESRGESIYNKLFTESQLLIMKTYLQILNLGNVVCRIMQGITYNSPLHNNENDIVLAINVIKKAQKGFIEKQDKEELGKGLKDKDLIEKEHKKSLISSEKKKTFKTEVEMVDEIMSFAIGINEIEHALFKYIKDEKTVSLLSHMIKVDSISCLFTDFSDLENRCAEDSTQPKNLIINFNTIGNNIFKDRIKQLIQAIQEILIRLSTLFVQNREEIADFYIKNPSLKLSKTTDSIPIKTLQVMQILERAVAYIVKPRHDKSPNELLDRISKHREENYGKFKILDSTKTISEEKNPKNRQEMPIKNESLTKITPKEMFSELKSIRNKISEFKNLERKVSANSTREVCVDIKKPWQKNYKIPSFTLARPFTVSFNSKSK
ncbi:hypothetical protein SteCoe_28369 [Stentor coeruleus]|uniref:Uncharacterized protein n=1 Tax=Stentor coeruleus TaxID=5963 RepID=A0A1R2B8D0_9CILI|nr:hypothetical protein SteCoe_28369 [Stentor coeruleus]